MDSRWEGSLTRINKFRIFFNFSKATHVLFLYLLQFSNFYIIVKDYIRIDSAQLGYATISNKNDQKSFLETRTTKMSVCKAVALDGPAKGKECFRPASDNGYCLKHQRNMLYDTGLLEDHKWCRMFTRGCNNQLPVTAGPTCEDCLTKKRGTVVLCIHTGCKFKKSEAYDPYCEVHSSDFLCDKIAERGKKPCKNFNRGCRAELDMDFKYKACDDCRTKEVTKHKELIEKRATDRETYELENPGKSLCVECSAEFVIIITGSKGIPLQRCKACHKKQILRESARAPRCRSEPEITIVRRKKPGFKIIDTEKITIVRRKKPELKVIAPILTDDVEWKLVPPELIDGYRIEASKYGELRFEKMHRYINTNGGAKNSHGIFSIFKLHGKTRYVHHLVFWAHSGLSIKQFQHGRVVFKSKLTEGGVIDGMLTNRYEDLMFQPSKDFNIEIPTISHDKHPLYGNFMYGHWYTVHAPAKTAERTLFECPMYELCLLDRPDMPCVIRHKVNPTKLLKMETVASTDPSIVLSPEKGKPLKYKLVHIVLASVFPTIPPNETVDHVDMNANNHHIKNLQWVSMAENAKGGQAKSVEVRKENQTKRKKEPNSLPGEEWRPLTLNPHTATIYEVSNMGRIKNTRGITRGSVIRGKNYSYLSINIAPGINKKEYIHRLVYQVFCAEDPYAAIPEHMSILHKDVTDGSVYIDGPHGTPIYRNWACDLRLGTKTENNKEYHANKRATS